MGRISVALLVLPLLARMSTPAAASELVWDSDEKPLAAGQLFDKEACPDHAHYAAYPQ